MTRSHFGSIKHLGEDRYRIRCVQDGKRLSRYIRGTRDDAEIALAQMRLDGMPSGVTWRQFWNAKVDPQIEKLAVKTRTEYRRLWRVELEPRIGSEPVANMDWHRANAVLTSISAPSVQRSAGRLLKKMCNMAIRDRSRLIAYNPVDRAIEYAPHRRRRKNLVDSFGVSAFLEAIRGMKYEPLLLCELGGGLRVEEACALCWEDIRRLDFDGSVFAVVTVDKALVNTAEGKILKDTKNESSMREAVIGEPFASRLLELSDGMCGPLCPSGMRYSEEHPERAYTSPESITHNWRSWCARHGVEYVRPKDLRSSYSTIMGEAGAEDSVVSGNMGHSDGTTKGRNYQSVTLVAKCNAALVLARWIDKISKKG